MKYLKIIVFVVITLLVIAGGAKIVKTKQAEDANNTKVTIYPLITKTIDTKVKDVTLTSSYIAEVKNDKEVVVNSKFSGKILKIKNLGDRVKKGEVVVSIDSSDLKAKLIELKSKESSIKNSILAQKATLNNAISSLNRTKKLLKVKMASIEELQNQENKIVTTKAQIKANENSLNEIKASIDAIKNSLTYTDIKSPVDGVISAKFFNASDNAFTGKPILKIAPSSGNYLSIALPKDYNEIIYKDKTYPLVSLKASFSGVKLFKATINDNTLVTGQKVNIDVVLYKGNATLLPYDSILSIDKRSYIFIYKDNRAKTKEVHIIESGKEGIVAKEKIEAKVIVAKPDILLKIKGGFPVKIAK